MSTMSIGRDPATAQGPSARTIASGEGWSIAEYICTSGPHDRPFEEQHNMVSIALVREGTFRYRSERGTSLLYPGALLLGNHGTCYECGHDHSIGDRCLAFHFTPEFFAEVAARATGLARYRFPNQMMPANRATLPFAAEAQSLMRSNDAAAEETAVEVLEAVLSALTGATRERHVLSAADERRVSDAISLIEESFADPPSLDALARAVSTSKYHFLRTFRRITGVTPHQYLLRQRLVEAAARIVATSEPIAGIAFDVGFGDLSTFNTRFRREFGDSPTRFRQRYRGSMVKR